MRGRLGSLTALLFCASLPKSATAKSGGIHSPHGRVIYDSRETFREVVDPTRRNFSVEVAAGAGPEGNFGVVLGWKAGTIPGLQYSMGFGIDVTPALNYSGALRQYFDIQGYRPYIALGYSLHDSYAIGSWSHNVFGELGYQWVLRSTATLNAGVGVRRILRIGVGADSFLRQSDADPALLEEQRSSVEPWVPLLVVRFVRSF